MKVEMYKSAEYAATAAMLGNEEASRLVGWLVGAFIRSCVLL